MTKEYRKHILEYDKLQKESFAATLRFLKVDIELSEGLFEWTNNIDEFEFDMSFRKTDTIDFIFYPLQFFMRISDAIYLKDNILKKSIIRSMEKNDLITSSILLRSNFELMVFYIYLIEKMFTYLKTNNIKDMHKFLTRIYFGKVKKEDKDNMLNEDIINFFGKEYLNLNKRIHIGDMITHVSRIKKENFISNFTNTKILEDPIFSKIGEKLFNKFDKNENIQDIYDVISEYVHPTSFRMIERISRKKIKKSEKNIEDVSVLKNFDIRDYYDDDAFLNNFGNGLFWVSFSDLNLISLYIYMNFYNKFKTNKKLVDNALGIRVINDNKEVYEVENIDTGLTFVRKRQ